MSRVVLGRLVAEMDCVHVKISPKSLPRFFSHLKA
jgi:hypothetical protein